MAFQIKNFLSIIASMINHVRGTNPNLTDFSVGAVGRTLLEAPAVELEELYLQMLNGLVESIPVATYQAFSFARRAATYATGQVTFVANVAPIQDIDIAAGTVVLVPGTAKEYETSATATLAVGETEVTVPIQALLAGTAGNTLSGTITKLQATIAGIDSLTNALAITSGLDQETDGERKARFGAYIATLARATIDAIEYGASTAVVRDVGGNVVEYVDRVGLVEEIPGRVSVYIFNGQGSTSDDLVTEAQKIIDGYVDSGTGARVAGYRAGGTMVTVRKMTEQAVAFTVVLTMDPGYTVNGVASTVQAAFEEYLSEVTAGSSFYAAELTARVVTVEGVANALISAPAADIAATANTALVPGAISIT